MKISKLNIAVKTLLLLLSFCIFFNVFAVKADAVENEISSESSSKAYAVYLYNVEKDSILFDKNSDKKIFLFNFKLWWHEGGKTLVKADKLW